MTIRQIEQKDALKSVHKNFHLIIPEHEYINLGGNSSILYLVSQAQSKIQQDLTIIHHTFPRKSSSSPCKILLEFTSLYIYLHVHLGYGLYVFIN